MRSSRIWLTLVYRIGVEERALFDNDPVHGPAIRQAASDSLLTITSAK